MVHGINASVGHSQAAEVDPGIHGITTLVENLSCLGVQSIEHESAPQIPFPSKVSSSLECRVMVFVAK